MLWSSRMGVAWIESCVVVFAVLRLSRRFSNTLRRAWHSWLAFGTCDRVKFELRFCYIIPGGAHVVVQPHCSGSFGVVSVQFKVWALHVQRLEVLLPLFHAGCNSCSVITVRPSFPGQVWSSHALTFMIYRLCLRFIATSSLQRSLPRVPSRSLGSL